MLQFTQLDLIQKISVSIIPVLFAVVLHEVAHGRIARLCGDNTAWQLGRLSLNPLKHIDPVGTILVPLLLVTTVGVIFGWARPVPVNWANLNHPRRDMIFVAAAGPLANLIMAIFWAIVLKLMFVMPESGSWFSLPLSYMAEIGILANVILMVFNLLPLPPLDGGRIAVNLLPGQWGLYLAKLEPFGFIIILVLLTTGYLSRLIFPGIVSVIHLIQQVVGIS